MRFWFARIAAATSEFSRVPLSVFRVQRWGRMDFADVRAFARMSGGQYPRMWDVAPDLADSDVPRHPLPSYAEAVRSSERYHEPRPRQHQPSNANAVW